MAAPATLTLGSQVFNTHGDPTARSTPRPSVAGVLRSITIYHLPEDFNNQNLQKSLMAAMTLVGRSTDTRTARWQSWVLSFTCIAYAGFRNILSDIGPEYHMQPLPEAMIESVIAAEASLRNEEEALPILFPADFPETTHLYTVEVYNAGSLGAVYSYYSLCVFLMGKQINAQNRESITVNRPRALIAKFKMTDRDAYILSGEGKMGPVGHAAVNQAWTVSTAARKPVIKEFATFVSSDILSNEVMYVTFKLLEHAGLQSAFFIHTLLAACPWAVEVPLLKPAYEVYARSIEAYVKEPAYLRPFFKLLYGDATRLFHSKTMADLTVCAVRWVRQTTPSVGFYRAPGSDKAVAAFAAAAARHNVPFDIGVEAEEDAVIV